MAEPKHRVGVEKAARVAGVSRWTIHRRIKAGALSCSRDKQGHPLIDLAELSRVFDLEPGEVAAALAELRGARRSGATAAQSTQRGATVQPGAERAAQAATERLEAELRRERERVERLEAELREARAAADAWADRYVKLAERALLTDQRPDRPAPAAESDGTQAPGKAPDLEAAAPGRQGRAGDARKPPRTPEQSAGVVESIARGILGDDLPNLVFGRRR